MTETIFTLDARDNMFLDVMKGWSNQDEIVVFDQINGAFKECASILKKK